MMERFFVFLLAFNISVFATTTVQKLHFESGITIYGQVGFVDLIFTENNETNTYKMEIKTTSTGLVKVLTGNRIDYFISEGKIIDGVYRPDTFTKRVLKTDYEKRIVYYFDYEHNVVVRNTDLSEYIDDSEFDPYQMRFVDIRKHKQKHDVNEIELYPNDYLSLYLNLRKGNLKKGVVTYVDRKDSDTLILVNKKLIEVQKKNGEDIYHIAVHYDGDDLFFKKVESIGVSFYGDAYIEKTAQDIKATP